MIYKQKTAQEKSKPWYKYPMVWMVILLPITVILASSVTIYIAFENAPTVISSTSE